MSQDIPDTRTRGWPGFGCLSYLATMVYGLVVEVVSMVQFVQKLGDGGVDAHVEMMGEQQEVVPA